MNQVSQHALSLRKEVKWHGDHNENANGVILKAGQLSMVYEMGNLRYISLANHEIIRMFYSAVRDPEWLTVIPEISEEEIHVEEQSFSISYTCLYRAGEINFSVRYFIEGYPDSSLNFRFEGVALAAFEKNRIGFCILHPVEGLAGEEYVVTHSNDKTEALKFPLYISPFQPSGHIKSMKWKIGGNLCSLDFYGEIFEMEDQRNWTDSSYKTYCTPLGRPFPVKLSKGEKCSQRIDLKVDTSPGQKADIRDTNIITVDPETAFEFPMIGICRTTRPEAITEGEIDILKELRFDHYRVELYLFQADWKAKADLASREAEKMGWQLELALFFDENAEDQAAEFFNWKSGNNCAVSLILFFHRSELATPDFLTMKIVPLFRKKLPGIKSGCGTNANFAQLNRTRPKNDKCDFITYSIHPQEHAYDNLTLAENLQAQAYTVESCRQFSGEKRIWISPVTLRRRFNANIEYFENPSPGSGFPVQADSRQMSLFAACWTVGSLKYLSESGVKGVTYFETVGERGILQGDFPSRWPAEFNSVSGMIFPVFLIFNYILKLKADRVVRSRSSHPLNVECFAISTGNKMDLILANMTAFCQEVLLKGWAGEKTIQILNEGNYADAVSDSSWSGKRVNRIFSSSELLTMEPFSIAFIEG